MSGTERTQHSEKEVVAVTKHGQATIPKQFREKLGITAPGKVLFREAEDGTIVVEHVRSPGEMRGFAARQVASTDQPATEILQTNRQKERTDREEQVSTEE
jgi:AbrB family looped-hinge helix DNA binding protein